MNATSSTTAKTIIGILAVIGALALISLLFMALMRRDEQDGQRHDAHDVDVHGCREQLGSHARQRSGHLHERQRGAVPSVPPIRLKDNTMAHQQLQSVSKHVMRAPALATTALSPVRRKTRPRQCRDVVGTPIAAGVLHPWLGLLLSPMLASAAMSLSSVSAISNALRLRRATL